jgi:hypothetical protein
METLLYYIDESYCQTGPHWHCNIGGSLLAAEGVVDAEIALESCIFDIARTNPQLIPSQEFKYSDFFRSAPVKLKLKACTALSSIMAGFEVDFVVSHAKIESVKLTSLSAFGSPSQAIQQLAHINIGSYLAKSAETHCIQTIVDLGLSESFRPVYEVYAGSSRGLKLIRAQGVQDVHITVPHYRRLLPPAFVDSKDSRLLQFSDLLIGLLLCRETGRLTPFKQSLLDCMAPVMPRVKLTTVEWNAQ